MIENGWHRALAATHHVGRALVRDPVGLLVAMAAAAGDSGPTAALLAVRREVYGAPMRALTKEATPYPAVGPARDNSPVLPIEATQAPRPRRRRTSHERCKTH